MEPHARRDIEFQIGMVHAMQSPKRRHRMKQHMLKVDDQVEENDTEGNTQPKRPTHRVENAPTSVFGDQCEADGGGRKEHPDKRGVDYDHAEISGPPATTFD